MKRTHYPLDRPKLLVLGATGMLGHMVLQEAANIGFIAAGVCRKLPIGFPDSYGGCEIIQGFDIRDQGQFYSILKNQQPGIVLNCIGIVKQTIHTKSEEEVVFVNSVYPHLAANACAEIGIHFWHLSTDCVFSGKKGFYRESDLPDPVDYYGLSKWAGEPIEAKVFTIRTSMFGPELGSQRGLLEWFLSNKEKVVDGYTNAIFSGFYTRCLARLILELIQINPSRTGLRHLAPVPINKYDMLLLIRNVCRLEIEIRPKKEPILNRSLDSSLLLGETGIVVPSWTSMIETLAADLKGRV